jgi:ReqiPepy6 Gp37-like protein
VDLYTMNENFIPNPEGNVDEFQSAIWTERYSAAGEVQLVVPASPTNLEKLKEKTYLGLVGSDEVMELKTDSIEDGLMTVVGKGILEFLDNRIHWPKTTDGEHPISDYTPPADIKLGALLADRVDKMVINPVPFPTTGGGTLYPWNTLNLDWERDKIPSLSLGAVDAGGVAKRWTVPVGPLYSVLSPLATQDGLGLRLYLESADADLGYILKFSTYRGVDRTGAQTVVPTIRLLPDMEALTGLKELRSIDGYKNVVYVVYQNQITIHYEDPDNIPEGLQRRVMIRDAEGEPIGTTQNPLNNIMYSSGGGGGGYYGGGYSNTVVVGAADIAKFREQNAKDALANNNYIRAIDGQVSQSNEYKFGTDYGMGDILELQGLTGVVQNARVTEYIRAQDAKGEREYPTLSVITGTEA